MGDAARQNDDVRQNAPHCHAPIHPPAPVPTPVPHPAQNIRITGNTSSTVFINGMPAATLTSRTAVCSQPSCVPGGPGIIAQGSTSVTIGGLPAARKDDPTAHPACAAPIPSPVGRIVSGSSNVGIGG